MFLTSVYPGNREGILPPFDNWWCWVLGFPGIAGDKEPTCQCRRRKRRRFHPWVGKIAWRRKWEPTPVFLPGEPLWTEEPGGLQSIGSQRVWHDWSDLAYTHTSKRKTSTPPATEHACKMLSSCYRHSNICEKRIYLKYVILNNIQMPLGPTVYGRETGDIC